MMLSNEQGFADNKVGLAAQLQHLHEVAARNFSFLNRIAVALYDDKTDMVRTFAYSGEVCGLNHYQAKLSECHSLLELARSQGTRVEQDLSVFADSQHRHAYEIFAAGYRSSYTVPMMWQGQLLGFVFFNADQTDAFYPRCLSELDLIAQFLTLLVATLQSHSRTLLATLRSARDMTHSRDPETAYHLERMSRYARLIALRTANKFGVDDTFVEHVYLFSPLHDLGKISIPDRVLLKTGKLTDAEFQIMKGHTEAGAEMVDKLMGNFGLNNMPHISILRNIVRHHHEALDGSGYPDGLLEAQIPLEAKIVAVADVFDALTSKRPYKDAWDNERAFTTLRELAGSKLDSDCVDALIAQRQEVEEIQRIFKENPFG
ncbi:HD-GYP domain-containing protein [Bowmanella pacifica]|uniref:Transcriptional regulator n=1 Tax=Bowmanella pacifica TaxID=502051 RepID=A0A917Z6B9_9ALTE|nr:HD domain-containing phosphohydrolase [Bowmanella pacifica]GGO74286.1 transcriptional regulator [Bowmanella pacifica]